MKEKSELFGQVDSAFQYDKAPPRGRLENIRDFSHKKTYKKFHEDDTDPQAV